MKTAIIIVATVLGLAAVGAGGYWLWSNNFSDTAVAHRAFSGDGAATCTYVDAETGDEGTMYIRNGEVRAEGAFEGELLEENAESNTQGHMLMKDDTMYVWTDGEEQGVEFTAEDENSGIADNETLFGDYEDEEELEGEFEEYQVDCSRGADADLFELPDNIEFINFNEMFEQMMDFESEFEDLGTDFEDSSAEAEEAMEEAMEQIEQLQ